MVKHTCIFSWALLGHVWQLGAGVQLVKWGVRGLSEAFLCSII